MPISSLSSQETSLSRNALWESLVSSSRRASGSSDQQSFSQAQAVEGIQEFSSYGSDARMKAALARRDQDVRQREDAQGEAVGGPNFIYQTGPDGQSYAIGSRPHLVKRENESRPEGQAQGGAVGSDGERLSSEDQDMLNRLQERDAHVRSHEQAHMMAAGGQAQGLPTYTYQTGPDGRQYAIGGAVNISISSSGDPEQTARQAETARQAATAVGDMSTSDALTAEKASQMSAQARQRALDAYSDQAYNF